MTGKEPKEPHDPRAAAKKAREARLASALRANLKRRKVAPQVEPAKGPAPRCGTDEPTGED